MDYSKWHWRVVNLLGRLFGLVVLILAIGFALSGMAVPALFLFLLSAALLGVRPYRPDLGDRSYLVDPH